jgi:hypothetical protein
MILMSNFCSGQRVVIESKLEELSSCLHCCNGGCGCPFSNRPTPELMQETHACFFSLIRDVICSTPDHRMSLTTLEDRLKAWQENPISPLNDWYSIAADSWLLMLSSAISFLSGDFTGACIAHIAKYISDLQM